MPLTDDERKAKDLAERDKRWDGAFERCLASQRLRWADEGMSSAEIEAEVPVYKEDHRRRYAEGWEKTGILQDIRRMFIRYGQDREYASAFMFMIDINRATVLQLLRVKSSLEELLQDPESTREELEKTIILFRCRPDVHYRSSLLPAYLAELRARITELKAENELFQSMMADIHSGKIEYNPAQFTLTQCLRDYKRRLIEEDQNASPDDAGAAALPPSQRRRLAP